MIPQKYYKVNLSTMPDFIRARNHWEDHHTYRFKYTRINPRACEICWQEEGSVTELKDGVETTYAAGYAKGFIHNELREVYSYDKIHHEYTLIIYLAEAAEPLTEEELVSWKPQKGEAVIPGIVQDARYNQKLAVLIKRAVQEYNSASRSRQLRTYGTLMEILALMTDYSLSCVQDVQKQSRIKLQHCKNVCAYITEHLQQKLSVSVIAEQTGISPNYLPQLFSETMGEPLVAYINRQRIQTAQQLLIQHDASLEQLAETVGISDPKYFCRLFKKYAGITVSEYKKQYR